MISICDRVLESLEQHRADHFADGPAVGGRVEGPAFAARRQQSHGLTDLEDPVVGGDMDAAHQSRFALAVGQTAAGPFQGDEGRGTGIVDDDTGTAPIEQIGQPAGETGPDVSKQTVRVG